MGKIFGYGALVLIALMAIGWILMGNEFFMYKFFAPRQEAVRRQVYEQTKSDGGRLRQVSQGSDSKESLLKAS